MVAERREEGSDTVLRSECCVGGVYVPLQGSNIAVIVKSVRRGSAERCRLRDGAAGQAKTS